VGFESLDLFSLFVFCFVYLFLICLFFEGPFGGQNRVSLFEFEANFVQKMLAIGGIFIDFYLFKFLRRFAKEPIFDPLFLNRNFLSVVLFYCSLPYREGFCNLFDEVCWGLNLF